MSAIIYVTTEAFATLQRIKDLDYYDRSLLIDEEPAIAEASGFYFKNAKKMNFAPLPSQAIIAAVITADNACKVQLSFPAELRGCIFEKAPYLPEHYAEIVTYWSGETFNPATSGAVYFQCKLNEYCVDLGDDAMSDPVINDHLLSEGVVISINGLSSVIEGLSRESFIEIAIPLDTSMLGIEQGNFLSSKAYDVHSNQVDTVFLKVADILDSPDPDHIYIDLLRHELLDYGYWY